MSSISKKTVLLTASAAAVLTVAACAAWNSAPPFEPTMESLAAHYQTPEWYQNAKFGIFAHWGPQCQPEEGDWYARGMYEPGNWKQDAHRRKYGDPKDFGFKDVIHSWKAQNWNPKELAALFKKMGASYVVSMANHHDNFDMWNSKYQEWNSVRVGPKRDIAGEWKAAVKGQKMHWGVSIHASHAWCWYEPARAYDGLLKKSDGAGTWWGEEGLDPQELYAQNHEASRNNRHWEWDPKEVVPPSQEYRTKFMNRHKQLIDDYQPEVIFFDDTVLPFYPLFNDGVELAAYYYNKMYQVNRGKQEVVITGKVLNAQQRKGLVWDMERGVPNSIVKPYWQCDTCLGCWHYERGFYDRNQYKDADTVIRMMIDIVSKGGNLLLSVPIRGDGTIDEKERAVCDAIADWMKLNGEGIHDTRTWKTYGEGPQADNAPKEEFNASHFNEGSGGNATHADLRFTTKDGNLYIFTLVVPKLGSDLIVKSLAGSKVKSVSLLGSKENVKWKMTQGGLIISTPDSARARKISVCYKVELSK